MRTASRSPVLALVGALAMSAVAGTGCESPVSRRGPNPFVGAAATQRAIPPADVRPLRDVVAMGAPRPLDDAMTPPVWRWPGSFLFRLFHP